MNANDCPALRISCLAALETAACAAFIKESRMECASATNTNSKSGTPDFPPRHQYQQEIRDSGRDKGL
jgi:hypothetical protein